MHPDSPPPLALGGPKGAPKVHKPVLLVAALLWRQARGPDPIRFIDLERVVGPVLQSLAGAGDRERVLHPFWRLEPVYWSPSDDGVKLRPYRPSAPNDPVRHLADTREHASGRLSADFAAAVDAHGTELWIAAILNVHAPRLDAGQVVSLLREAICGTPEDTDLTDPTLHTLMQWQLLTLGHRWGYTPWINPHDAGRSVLTIGPPRTLGGLDGVTTHLPSWLGPAGSAVGRIDVMWLEKNSGSPREMFEVENSTAIHSGILRMSDFLVTHANLDSGAHVVVPPDRLPKALEEIGRPTFRETELTPHLRVYTYPDIAELLDASATAKGTPRERLWAKGRMVS